ncbi:cation/cationic drug transporter [Brevibacillus fluminis]|uniref:Cation/cationic drug transporter n=1 Tax=Brevibacillus fluminis TaxID=511487 RepID=A0A3M8D5P6_9BACL|nr:SMR family transporter [Brevibacillus fluminis]RNB83360.1 cation/cationic drug transporter [Brevibacillus fluminis]
MPSLLLILISVILSASGQVAMKMGASSLSGKNDMLLMKFVHYLTNLPIMVGLALYGISAFVWIAAIEKVRLSYAYPMAALGYVLVAAMSVWFFHEPMSPMRIAGLAIIVVGVVVISQS